MQKFIEMDPRQKHLIGREESFKRMPHNKKSDSFLKRSPPSHLLAAKFMSIVICHLVLQHREGLLCQLLFKEYILAHQTFDW